MLELFVHACSLGSEPQVRVGGCSTLTMTKLKIEVFTTTELLLA